jgi:hypothetical protein
LLTVAGHATLSTQQKTRDIQGESRMLTTSRRTILAGATLVALGFATAAAAQETVKIGAVYPLSGNSASAGEYSRKAMEVGVDVINNGNAELAKIMPTTRARRPPARTRLCGSSPRRRSRR